MMAVAGGPKTINPAILASRLNRIGRTMEKLRTMYNEVFVEFNELLPLVEANKANWTHAARANTKPI